jgi:hypothetical protein
MTQHLGTPPRPWAGLETHLHAVPESQNEDGNTAQRRKLAALSLALGYLARKRAGGSADAG